MSLKISDRRVPGTGGGRGAHRFSGSAGLNQVGGRAIDPPPNRAF